MLSPESIIRYLANTSSFGGGENASFASASDHWSVSARDVRAGRLPDGTVRSIFHTAQRAAGNGADIQAVWVAVSLRTLCPLNGGGSSSAPLLMVGACLDARGRLMANPAVGAWVPTCRVATDEYHNEEVVVCGIDSYRAHQVAMSTLPNDGSWTDAVDRALDLFESINELHDEELRQRGLRMDDTRCLICLWPATDDVRMASEVLDGCLEAIAEDEDKTDDKASDSSQAEEVLDADPGNEAEPKKVFCASGSLAALMGPTDARPHDDGTHNHAEDAFITRKLVCGIVDHLPPLTPNDRQAVAAVAMQQEGDVAVLRTPKGSHAHRVGIAMLANAITTYALRGDDIPLALCVAPQEDLERMARMVASRPTAGIVDLSSRWLPRIDVASSMHAGSANAHRRILGPIGALFMYYAQESNMGHGYAMEGCLTKSFEQQHGGTATKYADPWYTPRASTYYLDCVSSFVGRRVHSLDQASQTLMELLRHIDQNRCSLIDSFAEVCNAWELHKQREGIIEGIQRLRREHAGCKERLRFWEDLLKQNPPRRMLLSRSLRSQASLIQEHALPTEHLALGRTALEDVCAAYRAEIERVEANLDRLRGASANLTRRIRAASVASMQSLALARQLIDDCGLSREQGSAFMELVEGEGQDVSLDALDAILDQTVRPAEFWLAVHAYEARWLDHRPTHLAHHASAESLWHWCNLCPIGLVPITVAVSALTASGHADIAVVMHSDAMETPRGLAMAAKSRQLVLMGSAASVGAWPLRGKTFDELHTMQTSDYDTWHELQRSRISTSCGVSMFEYAQGLMGQSCIGLTDVDDADAEIVSYCNDLLPSESISVKNAKEGPFERILPPISYVLVPDSSWAQVGTNRQNTAEAHAIKRWLSNHEEEIRTEYADCVHPVAIVAPYEAQARLIRETLAIGGASLRNLCEVVALKDLGSGTWPIAILCATCGPTALRNEGTISARTVLLAAASAAQHAFVLFCGGAWLRSAEEVAAGTMRRALRVGRLFSSPRKHVHRAEAEPKAQAKPEPDLRTIPVPLTTFIATLSDRGDIGHMPRTSVVVEALQKVGLIEKIEGQDDQGGSRPTAAGREIGIIAVTDRAGVTSCAYTNEAAPVIASLIDAMETE